MGAAGTVGRGMDDAGERPASEDYLCICDTLVSWKHQTGANTDRPYKKGTEHSWSSHMVTFHT